MRGTARAYFTGGYDRALQILFSDLWMIDLSSLFLTNEETSTGNSATDAIVLGDMGIIDEPSDALAPPALEVEAFASPVIPTSSSARLGFMTITSVVAVSTMFQFLRY